MKLVSLLASLLALAMLSPEARASSPEDQAHFIDVGDHKVDYSRDELGELTRIVLDPDAASAAADPDVEIFEVLVSYEPGVGHGWRAEQGLDPRFESVFATTGAHARLIATRTKDGERAYWFATREFSAAVTALRRLPDPPGAAIAVLRSNLEVVNTLRPDETKARPGA